MINKYTLVGLIKKFQNLQIKFLFLWELDYLIHGELNKTIKERSHLHKILEQELWVFWDWYTELNQDKSMRAVLENM